MRPSMAAKSIRISKHAQFEMQRRSITVKDVTAVVGHPQQVIEAVKGRRIYQSKIGRAGRVLLRVVVKEERGA